MLKTNKFILVTHKIKMDAISDVYVVKDTLYLTYNNKKYSATIQRSLQSYVKIADDENIEIINKEAFLRLSKQ
ncbi:hypothetical protein ECANGB1_876 [Enterospora canceri]|uniref:Uncharacterized protein n=1 Tax=Enterospora canceri TaxID=1081671 RepID=A0A1Y1S833_9MICR|nr:hypothetical protein ECANGB1_876 [Enterospora canceri]